MVTFLSPRCCDCGALSGKEHEHWCPFGDPGVLHESSVELDLKPDKPQEKLCDDASTYRVSTVSIDRQTLDLEALRPFFTKEALRHAVRGHLGEFGYRRTISCRTSTTLSARDNHLGRFSGR